MESKQRMSSASDPERGRARSPRFLQKPASPLGTPASAYERGECPCAMCDAERARRGALAPGLFEAPEESWHGRGAIARMRALRRARPPPRRRNQGPWAALYADPRALVPVARGAATEGTR